MEVDVVVTVEVEGITEVLVVGSGDVVAAPVAPPPVPNRPVDAAEITPETTLPNCFFSISVLLPRPKRDPSNQFACVVMAKQRAKTATSRNDRDNISICVYLAIGYPEEEEKEKVLRKRACSMLARILSAIDCSFVFRPRRVAVLRCSWADTEKVWNVSKRL